jgi:hypothetical protein
MVPAVYKGYNSVAPFPVSGNSESVLQQNFASTGKDVLPPGLSGAEGALGAAESGAGLAVINS